MALDQFYKSQTHALLYRKSLKHKLKVFKHIIMYSCSYYALSSAIDDDREYYIK